MTEDIQDLFKKFIEATEKAFEGPKVKSTKVYRDEDGLIHMVDPETGFHAIMGDDYYEALLKCKDLPPAKQYEEPKERPYKNPKPYYRKEKG